MKIEIKPSDQACGAEVLGVDLTQPLSEAEVQQIREWWLEYHVLSFQNQDINDDDLERFTLYFGPFGDDPFIAPIQGRSNIIAVKRLANEKSPLFGRRYTIFKPAYGTR
jgi:taurine dioxygenase